jgi:hypothetical protein
VVVAILKKTMSLPAAVTQETGAIWAPEGYIPECGSLPVSLSFRSQTFGLYIYATYRGTTRGENYRERERKRKRKQRKHGGMQRTQRTLLGDGPYSAYSKSYIMSKLLQLFAERLMVMTF